MPSPITLPPAIPETFPAMIHTGGPGTGQASCFESLLLQPDAGATLGSGGSSLCPTLGLKATSTDTSSDAAADTGGAVLAPGIWVLLGLGLGPQDIQAIMNTEQGSLSDDGLRAILLHAGMGERETNLVMQNPSLVEELKALCVQSLREFLAQRPGWGETVRGELAVREGRPQNITGMSFMVPGVLCKPDSGKTGPDGFAGSWPDGGSLDERIRSLVQRVARALLDKAAHVQTGADESVTGAGREAAPSVLSAVDGEIDGGAPIGGASLIDELEQTLGLSRTALKSLAFCADAAARRAALEEASSKIHAFLDACPGQEIPRRLVHALGLLKGLITRDEFKAVEGAWASAGHELPAPVSGPTVDRSVFEALAARLGENAALVRSESMREVMDQVRQAVFSLPRANQGWVSIRVHPPMLGRVDIEVSYDEGSITATFKADQPVTRDMIHQNLNMLKDALAEHGIKATQLLVSSENFSSTNRHGPLAWVASDASQGGSQNRDHGGKDDQSRSWRDTEMDGKAYTQGGEYTPAYGLDIIA